MSVKNSLIALAVAGAMSVPMLATAGPLDSLATIHWEDKKATAKYKLETHGFDIRVYEWVPKDNPSIRCVFVAGNTNSTGVACYPITGR